MAVFTEVSEQEVQSFIEPLRLGRLLSLRGIGAGIENTNYFVNTDTGEWVLTIFERLSFEQLPFYLRLMQHLALRDIPVPLPRADAQGEILFKLKGKPAAVVNKLAGGHQLAPQVHHVQQVGAMLARMHLQGRDFPLSQPNLRGLPWWEQTVPLVLPFMGTDTAALLTGELAFQQQLARSAAYQSLPRGPVHADLFRDNVMFDGTPGGETLSGFFDFYFAGVDTWLFDLAVCLNDWCIDLASGALQLERALAFVTAYESVRPLSAAEHRLLPALLRAGALRFWVSRLWDFHLPREASMLKPHDPAHFERVLRERIDHPWHALAS
jgi:homoserine kinase type II